MPIISSFHGMIIKMYFQQAEHNPPHFHVICGEYTASIDIQSMTMMEGDLPKKELALVLHWAKLHKNSLMDIWNTQKFVKLPPLS